VIAVNDLPELNPRKVHRGADVGDQRGFLDHRVERDLAGYQGGGRGRL
jgi:hypothetical protein